MRKSDKEKRRLPIGRDVRSPGKVRGRANRSPGLRPGEMTTAQATYRAIFDSVNDAIILRDLKTKEILDVNRTFSVMYGYTLEEAKKIPLGGFAASAVQDVKTFTEQYTEAIRGDPQLLEWEARKKDGTPFWVEINVSRVAIGDEEYLLSVVREVTERKRAMDNLRESERTFRGLLNAITEPVVLRDLNGKVLAINKTYATSIGKEPEEIVGTLLIDYFDPQVAARREKFLETVIRTGKPLQVEDERDGRHFEISIYPVFDDRGKVARVAVYARDVTRRKLAEKELQAESRRLEEMNTALKVLLTQRELDKKELEEKVLSNTKGLILPALQRLGECGLNFEARAFLDVAEAHVHEIISPFLNRLAAYRFTPKELEVISLVREGRTAKEISRLLNVCKGAVDIHRHRIRKKLGINNVKTNLRSYLLSLGAH